MEIRGSMAIVFALLEAFNRKEAAALGFFPCATASFLIVVAIFGGQLLWPLTWLIVSGLFCFSKEILQI